MRHLLCLLFLFSPLAFSAERIWLTELDGSRWSFEGDKNRCELTHRIDGFGKVSLVVEPGEPVSFQAQPKSGGKINALLSVESMPPPWHVDVIGPFEYLGEAETRLDGGIKLNAAQPLYDALSGGDWLWLSLKGQDSFIHSLQITNVHFPVASKAFEDCRSKLLPISYGSARNTTIGFANEDFQVDTDDADDLALIAELIASDLAISKVLIDGYAGDHSGRVANLRLSQSRAEEVASILVESGVPMSKLEIRWHGDRYLAESGAKKQSSRNRNATVRLIKKVVSGDS